MGAVRKARNSRPSCRAIARLLLERETSSPAGSDGEGTTGTGFDTTIS
jgi:hypothetical protein